MYDSGSEQTSLEGKIRPTAFLLFQNNRFKVITFVESSGTKTIDYLYLPKYSVEYLIEQIGGLV